MRKVFDPRTKTDFKKIRKVFAKSGKFIRGKFLNLTVNAVYLVTETNDTEPRMSLKLDTKTCIYC